MVDRQAPPPRYVWRRGLAFFADLVMSWLILAAFLGLIGQNSFENAFDQNARADATFDFSLRWALFVGGFVLPLAVKTTNCGAASPENTSLLAKELGYDRAVFAKFCVEREFGVPSGGAIELVLERVGDDGMSVQDNLTMEMTFESYWLKLSSVIGIAILILMSAAFGRFGGTSPGKLLVGLTFEEGAPTRPLRRELIKNAPNLIVTLPFVPFDLEWISPPALQLFGMNIVGFIVMVLHISALVWFWLLPLTNPLRAFVWSKPGEVVDDPMDPSA
ncbi:MAG: hypothetical protein I8H94_04050 [Rhodobacteraceae bacterium]|nr:hypothetical protein [Paracoccaceae bacterium]